MLGRPLAASGPDRSPRRGRVDQFDSHQGRDGRAVQPGGAGELGAGETRGGMHEAQYGREVMLPRGIAVVAKSGTGRTRASGF